MWAMRHMATYCHWLGCSRGLSSFTVVKVKIRYGAGAIHDVVYTHEDPSRPELDGELLHVGGPGEPEVQVKGGRAVRLRAGALDVPFGLCIVQRLLSSRSGHSSGDLLCRPTVVAGSCCCPGLMRRHVRCRTFFSQFGLTVHHIQGIKNEMADYISRNNFNAILGESSEAFATEAFQRMDVQLDLSMRTAGVLEGWEAVRLPVRVSICTPLSH